MKVVKMSEVPSQAAASAAVHRDEVTRQTPFEPNELNSLNFGIVSFSAGSRNKFHSHTSDQILIITEGTGVVATDDEERTVYGRRHRPDPGRREPLARRPRRHADGPHHHPGEGQPDHPDRSVSEFRVPRFKRLYGSDRGGSGPASGSPLLGDMAET